eukprot:3832830-Rhodomonas_salina.1
MLLPDRADHTLCCYQTEQQRLTAEKETQVRPRTEIGPYAMSVPDMSVPADSTIRYLPSR